jgi:hypothetical protein
LLVSSEELSAKFSDDFTSRTPRSDRNSEVKTEIAAGVSQSSEFKRVPASVLEAT